MTAPTLFGSRRLSQMTVMGRAFSFGLMIFGFSKIPMRPKIKFDYDLMGNNIVN
jgi:hypothetical protein